jgi:uncharacterized protein
MAQIRVRAPDVSLTEPTLVEGLPGVGLVGKIAADHLVEAFEMVHYADVHCQAVPRVAVYQAGDATLQSPLRLYADEERDFLVLQSDVPIQPDAATELADCLSSWFDEESVFPIFISGLAREKSDSEPALYGVGSGDGAQVAADADIPAPDETGLISGPTGALLDDAVRRGRTAVGLVVESDPRFPDPEAARAVIQRGVEPLTGIDVPVTDLVDRGEEIRQAKEQLARRMQNADEESTQARPLGMYQ